MRSPLKLLTSAGSAERSPEREMLEAVIRRCVAAGRAVQAARAAEKRADDMIGEAAAEKDNAEAALQQAREALTHSFGRAAVSAEKEKPTTDGMRAARLRLADAEDTLAAIRDTLPALKEATEDAEADLERASYARTEAKRAVLVGPISQLLDREETLRAELVAIRAALRSMTNEIRPEDGSQNYRRYTALGAGLSGLVPQGFVLPLAVDPQAWAAALAALDTDSDAPLPL
jgi:chromosome segregation ATPase